LLLAPIALFAVTEAACAAFAFEASSAAIAFGVRVMQLPGGASIYSAATGITLHRQESTGRLMMGGVVKDRVASVLRGNAPLTTLTIPERVAGIHRYSMVVTEPKNSRAIEAHFYNIARIRFLEGTGPLPPDNINKFASVLERTWPMCPK
jgi:hypothetical protein